MGKVVYQETTFNTDVNTGEILSTQQTRIESERIPQEPPFIKVYLEDVCALNKVPKSQQDVLYFLLKKLDYEGYITLSTRYRATICEELQIQNQTLANKIQGLTKAGLIHCVGRNEYEVNPYFFGRGIWADIYNNRQKGDFSMIIKYKNNGKREITTKLEQIASSDLEQVD